MATILATCFSWASRETGRPSVSLRASIAPCHTPKSQLSYGATAGLQTCDGHQSARFTVEDRGTLVVPRISNPIFGPSTLLPFE
jgi:hypothetical protein